MKRKGLKVNAGKSKVMVLAGEEGLEYEIFVDGIRLEHVSEFKYVEWVLDESVTDEAECSGKLTSGRRVASAINSLVKARSLQLEFPRVLNESLMVPVLTYGSEIMIWKKKEKSRIRAVQKDNLKGLLGIRRLDKVPYTRIRLLCELKKVFSDG